MTARALAGWRVLELADGVAASFCGKLLADLGAEVVQVEPAGGHPLRSAGPGQAGTDTARFTYLSTGKSSVVVAAEERSTRFQDLLGQAHVLITDCDLARVEELGGVPRNVIWASIRPFGLSGPAADLPASHLTVFHSAGEGSIMPSGAAYTMFPGRAPLQIGGGIADFDAGWNTAVAVLAAIRGLSRSGHARRIDVSAQESQLTLNRTRLSRYNNDGVLLHREGGRYGIYGMMGCADGWIQLVGMRPDHWDALLASDVDTAELDDPRLATAASRAEHDDLVGEAITAWCAARPKAQVVEVLAAIGCPVGAYATAPDLLASEQLAHRGFFQQVPDGAGGALTVPGAPYRFSATPVTPGPAPSLGSATGFSSDAIVPPRPEPGAPPAPLAGVRVLDFTWAAAGPYATLLLALLGAEVLKIESAGRPDPARRGFLADYGGIDRSPNFSELNINKRAIQVDLRTDEGRDLAWRLIDGVDVVVDNFRPGVMARLGFGAEVLLERRPELVVACSSANGSTGPEAMAAGLASIFGATGGLSEQTGYPDGPPCEIGESTDYRSANALAVGILAALLHRDRTGEGQQVDLASREVVAASAPDAVLAHSLDIEWPGRLGNAHPQMAPHGVYRCRGEDSWVALAVADEDGWAALCDLLGRPEWAAQLAGPDARRDVGEVEDALAAWAAERSPREASETLLGVGIASSPVMTNEALASDPHLAARGVFVDIEHPVIGRQRVMRAPWVLSDDPCAIWRAGPLMGQDNAEVLAELGITGDEAERLKEVMR